MTDAVIQLARSFVEVLGHPVHVGCPILVGCLIHGLDQFASHTRSAHRRIDIKILKICYIFRSPIVGVENIMHQSDHAAIYFADECILLRALWVDEAGKCCVLAKLLR